MEASFWKGSSLAFEVGRAWMNASFESLGLFKTKDIQESEFYFRSSERSSNTVAAQKFEKSIINIRHFAANLSTSSSASIPSKSIYPSSNKRSMNDEDSRRSFLQASPLVTLASTIS
jgi:hypothetical protein